MLGIENRLATGWIKLSILLVAVGCQDPNGQQAVSGSVTWRGEPLAEGYIKFIPATKGRGSSCAIANGKYEIESSKGLLPGEYKVQITSYKETGKLVPNLEVPGESVPETEQVIPPRYNQQTELMVSVSASATEFDFKLEED